MSCRKVQKQISVLMDGELSGTLPAEERTHLNRCEACRTFYEHGLSLDSVLKACKVGPVPAGLAQRIREHVLNQHLRGRPKFSFPIWCRVPVMAALVLVALGIGTISGRSIGGLIIESRSEIGMDEVIPWQTGSFAQVVFDLSGQESGK